MPCNRSPPPRNKSSGSAAVSLRVGRAPGSSSFDTTANVDAANTKSVNNSNSSQKLSPDIMPSSPVVVVSPTGDSNSQSSQSTVISKMTDDELLAVLQRIQAELEARQTARDLPGAGSVRSLQEKFSRDSQTDSVKDIVTSCNDRKRKGSSLTAEVEVHASNEGGSWEPADRKKLKTGSRHASGLGGGKDSRDLDKIEIVPSQKDTLNIRPESTQLKSQSKCPPQRNQPTGEKSDSLNTQVDGEEPSAPADAKIPPIVLRNKALWPKVERDLKSKGLNFGKAQSTADGIRIFPVTVTDFRGITRFLADEACPYHTYQLPSEKLLNVVLRGVPVEIDEKEVYDDLVERGFHPETLVRMKQFISKRPMPLILVKVPRTEKHIFDITSVISLEIKVETLKNNSDIGQCHRCQRFGHAQSRCTAEIKCVICAGPHRAADCPRSKEEKPTCPNCGGPHPGSYRGCTAYPKRKPAMVHPEKPKNTAEPKVSRVVMGVNYAQALRGPDPVQAVTSLGAVIAAPVAGGVKVPVALSQTTSAEALRKPEISPAQDLISAVHLLQDIISQICLAAEKLRAAFPSANTQSTISNVK